MSFKVFVRHNPIQFSEDCLDNDGESTLVQKAHNQEWPPASRRPVSSACRAALWRIRSWVVPYSGLSSSASLIHAWVRPPGERCPLLRPGFFLCLLRVVSLADVGLGPEGVAISALTSLACFLASWARARMAWMASSRGSSGIETASSLVTMQAAFETLNAGGGHK